MKQVGFKKNTPFLITLFCFLFVLGLIPLRAEEPVDLVDPFIDSANSRWFFFSSACRPFGMVNLSPDNLIKGTWGTGYRYNEKMIRGFSHIHAWQLSGISVMPVTGDIDPTLGADEYGSPFNHEKEIAEPGYHKVVLEKYAVTAELTSTTRVGFHRYTFSTTGDNKILFNLGGPLGPARMVDGLARTVNDREIEGYTVNGKTPRRPKECPVYFVAQFSRSFRQMDGWQEDKRVADIRDVKGKECGAILQFGQAEMVQVKVAISYVSIEQARLNLETELPGWDFDRVKDESRKEWNRRLDRIKVKGGTLDQRVRFYTDLWHALQGRRIVNDVNGKYSDMTGAEQKIGQIPLDETGAPKFNHYNSDSFWGAQWNRNYSGRVLQLHVADVQGRRSDSPGAVRRQLYLCHDRCVIHAVYCQRLHERHPRI